MSYEATIPQHDTDLYIKDSTTQGDVDEFLRDRLATPAILHDVIVFNFSSYTLDSGALVNAANELDGGIYVVPYQVPGVWGYMVDVLPSDVSETDLLTYRANEGAYHVYDNWRDGDNDETRDVLRETFEALPLDESV